MNTGKTALWIVGICVFTVALWIGIAASIWGLRVATAGIYGRGEARIQIQSADYRIPAYNHFFDLCAAIQGHEAGVEAARAQLEAVSEEDRDRILANIAGLETQRVRSIAQYNADAEKDYTIGQFRDSDLPYQLDKESKTKCTRLPY